MIGSTTVIVVPWNYSGQDRYQLIPFPLTWIVGALSATVPIATLSLLTLGWPPIWCKMIASTTFICTPWNCSEQETRSIDQSLWWSDRYFLQYYLQFLLLFTWIVEALIAMSISTFSSPFKATLSLRTLGYLIIWCIMRLSTTSIYAPWNCSGQEKFNRPESVIDTISNTTSNSYYFLLDLSTHS